jgi:hypothetical protein
MIIENVYVNSRSLGQADLRLAVSAEPDGFLTLEFDAVVASVTMGPRQAIDMAAEIIMNASKLLIKGK